MNEEELGFFFWFGLLVALAVALSGPVFVEMLSSLIPGLWPS